MPQLIVWHRRSVWISKNGGLYRNVPFLEASSPELVVQFWVACIKRIKCMEEMSGTLSSTGNMAWQWLKVQECSKPTICGSNVSNTYVPVSIFAGF